MHDQRIAELQRKGYDQRSADENQALYTAIGDRHRNRQAYAQPAVPAAARPLVQPEPRLGPAPVPAAVLTPAPVATPDNIRARQAVASYEAEARSPRDQRDLSQRILHQTLADICAGHAVTEGERRAARARAMVASAVKVGLDQAKDGAIDAVIDLLPGGALVKNAKTAIGIGRKLADGYKEASGLKELEALERPDPADDGRLHTTLELGGAGVDAAHRRIGALIREGRSALFLVTLTDHHTPRAIAESSAEAVKNAMQSQANFVLIKIREDLTVNALCYAKGKTADLTGVGSQLTWCADGQPLDPKFAAPGLPGRTLGRG